MSQSISNATYHTLILVTASPNGEAILVAKSGKRTNIAILPNRTAVHFPFILIPKETHGCIIPNQRIKNPQLGTPSRQLKREQKKEKKANLCRRFLTYLQRVACNYLTNTIPACPDFVRLWLGLRTANRITNACQHTTTRGERTQLISSRETVNV